MPNKEQSYRTLFAYFRQNLFDHIEEDGVAFSFHAAQGARVDRFGADDVFNGRTCRGLPALWRWNGEMSAREENRPENRPTTCNKTQTENMGRHGPGAEGAAARNRARRPPPVGTTHEYPHGPTSP